MGLLALLLLALAGWLIWTGRLQKMTAKDGLALGIALVGAVMAAKGKPLIGALPIIGSALFFALQNSKGKARREAVGRPPGDVGEARALLGLPADADAQAIRAAHRRLIATVHPDRGGTQALASKINAARDLLLDEANRAGDKRA
ncbi:J domain-containing protein [Sphingobium aromaticiconvertens]|uniref:J domain-containing protein n=1 Tax=Sphingobium aromaticiconvertens TaxID=365341 RepID=UPI003019FFB0